MTTEADVVGPAGPGEIRLSHDRGRRQDFRGHQLDTSHRKRACGSPPSVSQHFSVAVERAVVGGAATQFVFTRQPPVNWSADLVVTNPTS